MSDPWPSLSTSKTNFGKSRKQNSRHVINKEKLRLKHFDIKFNELLANTILVVVPFREVQINVQDTEAKF